MISKRRSSTRNGTSPPSCCCARGRRCSTSAPAGAALALYLAARMRRRGHRPDLVAGAAHGGAAARRGGRLSDRVRFHLRDYREETEQYDRIVSVGMFEHVGVNQYATFFGKLNELLAPDGVALLHSIGRIDGPGSTNPWLRKYIFPGGYSPGAVRGRAGRSSRSGCGSLISRSCACTTPRRCAPGASRFEQNRERIKRALRRALLPDVGDCIWWDPKLSFRRPGHAGVPDAAGKADRRRAVDPRLHGRLGARPQRRPEKSSDRAA